MAEATDLRDHHDKGEERDEEKPEGAFDGHKDAGGNNGAHDDPNQNGQQKFHAPKHRIM